VYTHHSWSFLVCLLNLVSSRQHDFTAPWLGDNPNCPHGTHGSDDGFCELNHGAPLPLPLFFIVLAVLVALLFVLVSSPTPAAVALTGAAPRTTELEVRACFMDRCWDAETVHCSDCPPRPGAAMRPSCFPQ
jgi:hypothetical protein